MIFLIFELPLCRPFVLTVWALYDLGLLAGSSAFVRHWGHWQNVIHMFNESNPSGNVTNSDLNYTILRLAIAVGIIVAIKRLVVGVFLSRQTFCKLCCAQPGLLNNGVLPSNILNLFAN